MPRPRKSVPSYRLHKQSGNAIVTLRTADGGRRDLILGAYNTPESLEEYRRILAELHAGCPIPGSDKPRTSATVNEVLLAFLKHAERHYRHPDGRATSELLNFKLTLRVVRELYGNMPVESFGPIALKAVREQMVVRGWCRKQINKRICRIRSAFKWAVAEELIPVAVYQSITTLSGLQAGRSGARETAPVQAIAETVLDATLPHMHPTIRAMAEVQLLTGMRPGEVCLIRPQDIDRSRKVWLFVPPQHKNSWRGKSTVIAIGPKAQAILARFEPSDASKVFFSPLRAVKQILATRTESRKTKRFLSHMASNAAKLAVTPKRVPSAEYCGQAYGTAIDRACDRAFPPPAALAPRAKESRVKWWKRLTLVERDQVKKWRKLHRWHPNQLRHTFATRVRREHGLEAAQVLLGHSKADVTQIYAEKNESLAVGIAELIG